MLNEFVFPNKIYWEQKEDNRGVFVVEPRYTVSITSFLPLRAWQRMSLR